MHRPALAVVLLSLAAAPSSTADLQHRTLDVRVDYVCLLRGLPPGRRRFEIRGSELRVDPEYVPLTDAPERTLVRLAE